MKTYDPEVAPDPEQWLELDEDERTLLVERYHRREHIALPNAGLHSTIHAVIETQLASDDPPQVRPALERLRARGLDRHDAVHAIGEALVGHLWAMFRDADDARPGAAPDDPGAGYRTALEQLGVGAP